jgi:DNA-binding transcriptional LysR family regulator
MHSHMDWDGVRVFLAVARAGRVSAAAKRLAVEHTTVSRRVAALEQELGTPLFYRTAGGYLLTPVGEGVLANAEAMERAATAMGARARETTGAVTGRVRLALVPEFASDWLAPHLPAFRIRYPSVELHILVGTRPLDLSRGEADIAIRAPNPRQTGLVAVRIAYATAGLYASKTFIGNTRLRIDDAASARGVPFLVYTPQFAVLQSAAWFRPILDAATVVLETNSTHTLTAAARASIGVAVLPRFVARHHPDLVAVSDDVAKRDVWLITHPEYRRDPKIRATADFLKQAATGPAGLW